VGPVDQPHHDGSELYVPEPADFEGAETTVLLRVPRHRPARDVAVRYVLDGEQQVAVAEVDHTTEDDVWWRASFPVWNRATSYRWLLAGGSYDYAWLNGAGLYGHDVPDADDFVATAEPAGPDWHLSSVVYEVFPDRFASSGRTDSQPTWARRREWGELPSRRPGQTPFDWFGGDLAGAESHLDHVAELGANVLYLTPFFPAGSTHRYDASSFETVDPLLGGDEALVALVAAAHRRGIRVVGDLTTNHVGAGHPWFHAAQDGRQPERGFFFFDERLPAGYESWLRVRTLPKLDYRSEELRGRMYERGDSVVRRWLQPPFDLDGWRIDVANMTGRRHADDLNAEVSRGVAAAAVATRPDALVVAEDGHDAREALRRGGWHGTMSYAGFTRPVWCWLRGDDLPERARRSFFGLPVGVPRLSGDAVVATMRRFHAGVPWGKVLHSWTLLDSHDTARFRTIAGSRATQLAGVGLQMTTPGVPMVFAGDELGLEGDWGEDARRTMPWEDPSAWDAEVLDAYRRLIRLRRGSRALQRGGLRYLHVGPDAIAYAREARGETVLCLAARSPHEPVRVARSVLGEEPETLVGEDVRFDGDDLVLPGSGPAFAAWRSTHDEGT
jgi:alpha-glucosidase